MHLSLSLQPSILEISLIFFWPKFYSFFLQVVGLGRVDENLKSYQETFIH